MTSLDLAFEEDFENSSPPPSIPSSKRDKKPVYIDDINYHQSPQSPQSPQSSSQLPSSPPPSSPPQQYLKLPMNNEKFTNYYNYQEQSPIRNPQTRQEYSFWDRMVISRREVMKLLILSIVIILAISIEKIGCHYINNYLSSNDLTFLQELLVRLSFPIIVFIILWIIKSL